MFRVWGSGFRFNSDTRGTVTKQVGRECRRSLRASR